MVSFLALSSVKVRPLNKTSLVTSVSSACTLLSWTLLGDIQCSGLGSMGLAVLESGLGNDKCPSSSDSRCPLPGSVSNPRV